MKTKSLITLFVLSIIVLVSIIGGSIFYNHAPRTGDILITDGRIEGTVVIYKDRLYPINTKRDVEYLDSVKKVDRDMLYYDRLIDHRPIQTPTTILNNESSIKFSNDLLNTNKTTTSTSYRLELRSGLHTNISTLNINKIR